jgi:hypothetical protein
MSWVNSFKVMYLSEMTGCVTEQWNGIDLDALIVELLRSSAHMSLFRQKKKWCENVRCRTCKS